MALLSRIVIWGGGFFISGVFLDSLRFKFAGHPTPEHIFTTLRDWSGIGLFYPAGPWIIGLGELAASLLLIGIPVVLLATHKKTFIGLSQFAGAAVALAIMSGAIVFHLITPLGIATPVEWDGATATKFSPALFYSASASWVFAAAVMILRRGSLSGAGMLRGGRRPA